MRAAQHCVALSGWPALADGQLGCCRREDAQALGVKGPDEAAGEGALAVHAPLAIACWRGRASVNLLVNRAEAKQLAEKLRYAMAKRRSGQSRTMGAQMEKGADVQASS